MANPTMTLIASTTVGSGGVSSVTFSSIPATYTDLVLKSSTRDNSATLAPLINIQFNGDTSANYDWIRVYGDGGSVTTQKGSTLGSPFTTYIIGIGEGATATASVFSNTELYISNYANTTAYKSSSYDSVVENNAASGYTPLLAGIWKSNSAITSINLTAASSFVQYSTFYLYGINNS